MIGNPRSSKAEAFKIRFSNFTFPAKKVDRAISQKITLRTNPMRYFLISCKDERDILCAASQGHLTTPYGHVQIIPVNIGHEVPANSLEQISDQAWRMTSDTEKISDMTEYQTFKHVLNYAI